MSIAEQPTPTPASRALHDDSFLQLSIYDDRPRERALMWTATITALTAFGAAMLAMALPL